MHTTRKYGVDCGDQHLAVSGVQITFHWHKCCTTTKSPSQQFKEHEANQKKNGKLHISVHSLSLSLSTSLLANITFLATFLGDMAKSIYQVLF